MFPDGVLMVTTSPSLFPTRDLEIGDVTDSFPFFKSASSSPTILYVTFLLFSSTTITVVPKITLSDAGIFDMSIT